MLAWVAVVLFQAVFHFGVLAPRRRRAQLEREEVDQVPAGVPTMPSRTERATSSEGKPPLEFHEDERDTFDHSVSRRSLMEQREDDSFQGNRDDPASPLEPAGRQGEPADRGNAGSSVPKPLGADDWDPAGDDWIDDDEPWRYELVRNYYSQSSPSIVQYDASHSDYDDEEDRDQDETNDHDNETRSTMISWKEPEIHSIPERNSGATTSLDSRADYLNEGLLRYRRGHWDAPNQVSSHARDLGFIDPDEEHTTSFKTHAMQITCA